MSESARIDDFNGWFEVARQPISKAGVFDYLGKNLTFAEGEPKADPNKVYRVFRSPVELARPEFLASLRLLPWVDEHTMLGAEELNATPAEDKGIGGVTGEQQEFDPSDATLYSNIKLFSEAHRNEVDSGKRELSLGYRCRYIWASGEYNGEKYDVIQCHLRGNHLASVGEGRMGPEVAVLDHNDTTGIEPMDEELKKMLEAVMARLDALEAKKDEDDGLTDEEKAKKLADAAGALDADLTDEEKAAAAKAKDEADAAAKAAADAEDADLTDEEKAAAAKAKAKDEADAAAKAKDETDTTGTGMDEASITRRVLAHAGRRDKLAAAIKPLVGAFDHSAQTEADVAAYGVKKLGITCPKGQELSALNGYLAAVAKQPAVTARTQTGTGMDAKDGGDNWVTKRLNGGK